MLKRLYALLAHTWVFIRHHDWSKEPQTQKQMRRWVVRGVRAMEYSPHTQWRYHLTMSWIWIISAVPILVLFFGFPGQWLRWGLLITLLYSLYANWVSDFTGLHAAWAALRGDQISVEMHHDDAIVQVEIKPEPITEE